MRILHVFAVVGRYSFCSYKLKMEKETIQISRVWK